jgi:hypothetical protein
MRLKPALVNRGDAAIRMMTQSDAPLVVDLLLANRNRALFEGLVEHPGLIEGFLSALEQDPWALPMVGTIKSTPVAALFNVRTDFQNLNTRLVPVLADLVAGADVLRLYVRHLFWTLPVQRVYAQFLADLAEYEAVLCATSFKKEGILVEHQIYAGSRRDVAVFGLLRADFETWCDEHDPELSLSSAR